MNSTRRPSKSRFPDQKVSSPAPKVGNRLKWLLLVGLGLLVLALWSWKEPLELHQAQKGGLPSLERYAAEHPESAAATRSLAEAYVEAGRPQEAVTRLTPWVERTPEDVPGRVLLARALLQSGETQGAYAHLQVVLSTLKPDDADARWWLGRVLERSGRSSEAYDQYETLLTKHPKHVPALLQLASLSVLDGRMTVAESFLRRATAADPRSAPAAAQLAEILFRLGRADDAANEARRALKLDPGNRKGSYWLGRSLLVLDAHAHGAEAEQALRRVIASGVDTGPARYHLAKLLQQQGRTAEAAAELKTNTRENRLHKDSFYDLALCERRLGHTADAEAAMKRFRALQALDEVSSQLEYRVWADPRDSRTRVKLARFYLDHQRPDLARPQVEAVLKQDPKHEAASRLLTQIQAHPEPALP